MNATLLQQFRRAVYQTFSRRGDAFFDLLDALTGAGHIQSPVGLSEAAPFRRRFSSIYDVLQHAHNDENKVRAFLQTLVGQVSDTLGGYPVYALDTTPEERPEARTLADRGCIRRDEDHSVQYGHQYSWLVRLVKWGTSWIAPVSQQRVGTATTASQVGIAQLEELDRLEPGPKIVVADSHYGNHFFLAVARILQNVWLLVRLRNNLNLRQAPPPPPEGKRKGPPRKHGPKFKLANPPRDPDQRMDFEILPHQPVRIEAWHALHFMALADVVGTAIRIVFLGPDGTPRHKYPLWLFWTGPTTLPLRDLCAMYLWRFAIEHAFRFLKQHLGLTANYSTLTPSIERWFETCLLAYWQLLLMRSQVENASPAWYPHPANGSAHPLTPWQVQRAASGFIVKLGTPATIPQPRGKGLGRPKGFHPAPRQRYRTVVKGKKQPKRAAAPG